VPGQPGPAGPSAASADAGNQARLGSDNLLFVPHDASKYDASNPTGYITGAAVPVGSSTPPAMDGTAAAGTQGSWARGDHVHPSDTSRAPVKGITDGSDAAAGNVGEYLIASNATGVALTSGVASNVTQLPLTPGDWRIDGVIAFVEATNTVPTVLIASTSQTSATLPTLAQVIAGQGGTSQINATMTKGPLNQIMQTGLARLNITVNTTIYLVAQSTFSAGTLTAQGRLSARRMR
jgi:hypothetical protein